MGGLGGFFSPGQNKQESVKNEDGRAEQKEGVPGGRFPGLAESRVLFDQI